MKLAEENADFQKAMAEYEYTVEELTAQIGELKEIKRERGLLEEELQTLAATLGRVQLEKIQMEKEIVSRKTEIDEMQHKLKILMVVESNDLPVNSFIFILVLCLYRIKTKN